jgi:hypothetical protein
MFTLLSSASKILEEGFGVGGVGFCSTTAAPAPAPATVMPAASVKTVIAFLVSPADTVTPNFQKVFQFWQKHDFNRNI